MRLGNLQTIVDATNAAAAPPVPASSNTNTLMIGLAALVLFVLLSEK